MIRSAVLLRLSVVTFSFSCLLATSERIVIDSITTVMYGAETIIITQSEIGRMSLEGTPKTQDLLVEEALLYHLAQVYNLVPSPEEVEESLGGLLRERNLSTDDFRSICNAGGMTVEEGKEEFRKMFARKRVVEFFVTSKLRPSDKAIREFFEKNPMIDPAVYQIQHIVVTYPLGLSEKEKEAFEKRAKKLVHQGKESKLDAQWSGVYEVTADNVAEDKPFLHTLQVGSISEPHKNFQNIIFFKMIERKEEQLVALEKRYHDIAQQLSENKFQELMVQLNEKARQKVSLVNL